MIRVAVIGSRGQLGSDLVVGLRDTGGYHVTALTRDDIDVTNPDSVRTALQHARSDIVVNCAAFVRVDDCEDHPETAFLVNAVGALYVARGCRESNALCVYISTDYVFDGQKGAPYTEEDCPRPLNVYGASKLAGETLVHQACPRSLVVRIASVFGSTGARSKGGNFVEAIIAKAQRADPIKVVDDIRMSPTYSRDAASGLEALLRREITGVIHLTNSGACTWYEFARAVLDYAGANATLEGVSSHQDGARARRPSDSTLDSARLLALHVDRPRPWQEALRAYLIETGRVTRKGS